MLPPVAVRPKQKGSEIPGLTVPEFDSSQDLAKFCDVLTATLETHPRRVRFRFIGPHAMMPDSALVIYDILTTRNHGAELIMEAWSPVLGASMLVWLAGNVRRVRSTTHFRFRSLQEMVRRASRRSFSENNFLVVAGDVDPDDHPYVVDYRMVLQLMDQYLPIDQLADTIITPAKLKELGLLENSPLDDVLLRCMGAGRQSQPIPPGTFDKR